MISSAKTQLLQHLDLIEKAAILVLYAALCYRFAAVVADQPINLIFLVSEGLVVLFVSLRRSTDQLSMNPMDWAVAFIGTFAALLVVPVEGGWVGGGALLISGLIISLGAKLSLRRSFGIVAANRGVQTRGLYAAVRHPMYLGYFITNIGMIIVNPSIWNAGLLAVWTLCQLARIRAEERILFQDQAYRMLAERVRFRLVPLVY